MLAIVTGHGTVQPGIVPFSNICLASTWKTAAGMVLAILMTAWSGCATITRGTKEALVIESEPNGAQVRLSSGLTGTTPTSFKIPRKGDLTVTVSKDGYETLTVNVTTQVAGAGAAGMAGNVLLGGVIGAGVDAFSGGMLEHKPNPVKVTLVPTPPAAAMPKANAATAAAPPAEPPKSVTAAAAPGPSADVSPVPK